MNVADQSLNLARRTQSPGEELANSISHAIGLVGAIIGTPVLLLAALRHASAFFLAGTIIFIVTMLLVYFGSTLYHAWPQTQVKSFLQVMDHSAMFLVIAGTYMAFALVPLRGAGGLTMRGVVWRCGLCCGVVK